MTMIIRSRFVASRSLQGAIRYQSTSAGHALRDRPPPPPPPADIAAWISSMTSREPELSSDLLDAQRAAHLQRTLPTRLDLPGAQGPSLILGWAGLGDELPKAHHLAYFQPQGVLTELGEDGSSTEYNAPAPYLRRMWAGGSFLWSARADDALRIGEPVTQVNSVARAEFKAGMIFVHQQRDLYRGDADTSRNGRDKDRWAVREVRTHVFRREVGGNEAVKARAKAESAASGPAIPSPTHTFTYTPTAPLLFRYSALTYNAHRIHYDRDWARLVEGHPNLVVHGPLTATLLIELAQRVGRDNGHTLRGLEYRATSPMYVDETIRLSAGAVQESGDSEVTVGLVAEQDGRVGMKATAMYQA